MNFREDCIRAGMVAAIALTCISITTTQPARADINDDMNAWDTWYNSEQTLENSERALSKLDDIQFMLRMQHELERARTRPLPPIQRPPPTPEHYPTVNDPYTYDPTRPGFTFIWPPKTK